jgi:hypothetical protein
VFLDRVSPGLVESVYQAKIGGDGLRLKFLHLHLAHGHPGDLFTPAGKDHSNRRVNPMGPAAQHLEHAPRLRPVGGFAQYFAAKDNGISRDHHRLGSPPGGDQGLALGVETSGGRRPPGKLFFLHLAPDDGKSYPRGL